MSQAKFDADSYKEMVIEVAKELAFEDLSETKAMLEDDDFEALEEFCRRIKSRGIPFLEANFGRGFWDLYCTVHMNVITQEKSAREDVSFSSWPMHLRRLIDEGEYYKSYEPFARVAISKVNDIVAAKAKEDGEEVPVVLVGESTWEQ